MLSHLPERFIYGLNFPGHENDVTEFKRSFNPDHIKKYLQTMCAFLNTKGGNIIFGITDNGIIEGFSCSLQLLDKIQLFVDQAYNFIVRSDHTPVFSKLFFVKHELITYNRSIVIITCIPEENTSYKLMTGDIYVRLNASIKRVKDVRLYTEHDLKLVQQTSDHINDLYKKSLQENKLYKKKNQELERLITYKDRECKNVIIQINDSLYDYYHVKNNKLNKLSLNKIVIYFIVLVFIMSYFFYTKI